MTEQPDLEGGAYLNADGVSTPSTDPRPVSCLALFAVLSVLRYRTRDTHKANDAVVATIWVGLGFLLCASHHPD